MNKVIHRAATRGYADRGWLKTWNSFSFADWFNPQRMHFGALRALNDDTIAPGEGFGMQAREDMEIVTIPLSGVLKHADDLGNLQEFRPGEIEVMTAGSGLSHSELNASDSEPAKLLQIWIRTDAPHHRPRYQWLTLSPVRCNAYRVIVAPEGCGSEHVGWIHQTAWLYTLELDEGCVTDYRMNVHGNGAYVFVLEGRIEVAGEKIERRDGMGIWEADEFRIKALETSDLLIVEVPME